MLAVEIGTKRTASVRAGLRPAVARRQHFREKGMARPLTPLRGHTVARTIIVVRMLCSPVPMRLE